MGSVAQRLNVLGTPLQICATRPITGFLRNGYCDSVSSDYGKHYLAAEVTDEFLDFSAKQGNDLRGGISQPDGSVAELGGGCKWCLCVTRWKEAFLNKDKFGDKIVPRVILEATHKDTLEKSDVTLDMLKQFEFKNTEPVGRQEL
ncbi:hypothetical protein P389DRAFT_169729 [Cystobasidium minutum MCA 4210]|uniref:uncharacterized protein n=1 Tax=Cystobasidium minutum MCA 4210 TaxID=1397322 RepID=UPI0034CF3375|eukprot:jgi/Rhomi1/169729/fgenesh1_kg.3_\